MDIRRLTAAMALWAALIAVPALGQDQAPRTAREVDQGRLFAAGSDVRVTEGATDDAFAVGARVTLLGTYAQNAYLAGGTVVVTGNVSRSVLTAGGTISIEGNVGHDLYAAGGTVRLREGAAVTGLARLAGGTVDVAGTVGQGLKATGGSVTIDGTITGDVTITAGSLRIGPTAHIGGNLTYSASTTADISPTATIAGTTRVLPPPAASARENRSIPGRVATLVATALALTILAAILHLAVPGILTSGAETFSGRPFSSFGIGLALSIGLPIAGLLLLITILGIPLAILLWVFGVVLWAMGTATAAYWIGLRLRSFTTTSLQDPHFWGRTGWTALGFVVLGLLAWAPYVGGILVWLIDVAAAGAVFQAMWARFRAPPPVPHHL